MASRSKLFALIGFFLVGCATTQVVDSWKDPSVKEPLHFQRIAVIAISKDDSIRRSVEDALVKKIGGDRAFASYTILSPEESANKDKAKAAIAKSGADGAVTMRLVDKSQQLNYVPGAYVPPSYSMWDYSSYAWGRVVQPGVWTTDTLIRIETNIYSAKEEKLLWSGMSETYNPSSIKDGVNEVADAVKKQLERENLIVKKK